MTDKELRKAKKSELIEILYFLRKELDSAQAENKELRARLDTIMAGAVQNSGYAEDSAEQQV